MTQQPAPGWLPDPQAPGLLRYWDGVRWTASTAPVQASDSQPQAGSLRGLPPPQVAAAPVAVAAGEGMAWAIALAPLVAVVVGIASWGRPMVALGFWIVVAVSLVLVVVDRVSLAGKGVGSSRMEPAWLWGIGVLLLAVVFVPWYLWKRARVLAGSRLTFWVWIAAFVVAVIVVSGIPSTGR